ncbi:MAG TPA: C40 family peptidase [Gaiellales bacterium]|nr:C40 family peptidase [Gaiellales bacterium]
MRERGQVVAGAVAALTAVLLAAVVLLYLARIGAGGAEAQTAADVAALAAARALAADPDAPPAAARAAAASAARANGARLTGFRIERTGSVATAVDVEVAVAVAGTLPVVGQERRSAAERARAGIAYTATLPERDFRPVDLHGAQGPPAAVAAAEAQVGWPYVWGGESRAEGGFDCSGLIDYAYAVAGVSLPGRPTAAELWRLSSPLPAEAALAPGDLVFVGAASGAPHHVGMYVGGGTVVAAPHSGAEVRYEPLAAGGWDGFGRLAGPPLQGRLPDPAIEAAARRHQVPAHVVAAELTLGIADDPEAAALRLAVAQRRHPGDLEAALADALGDASLAAAVLRRGSGPGLEAGAAVRLLPIAAPLAAGAASPLHAEPLPLPIAGDEGAGHGWIARHATEMVSGAQHVADHLEETRGRIGFQGAAGLRTVARAGLVGLASLLPEEWERDLSAATGSTWDAVEAVAGAARGGMPLGPFGIWAARFTLAGTLLFAASSFLAARRATRRDEWVVAVVQGAGYGLNAAGLATAGSGLLTAGVGTAEIPPVGLVLLAAGSSLLVTSYAYRHRSAIERAVDAVGTAARSTLHAAFDAVNPF